MLRIAEIRVHPLKSGHGESIRTSLVTTTGLRWDRQWMAVRPDGTFVNQKRAPRLGLIKTRIVDGNIEFRSPRNERPLVREIADMTNCPMVEARIYDSAAQGMDLGDFAADWISREIGEYVRLVQLPANPRRAAKYDPEDTETPIAFQDAGTMLIGSLDSLRDLNARIKTRGGEAVPMDRFRPNIIVEGAEPYEEETWRLIEVGGVHLHLTIPCRRCMITTLDPESAEPRGPEPLRTLATYRRWKRPGSTSPAQPIFCMNANHEGRGTLSVGDEIHILERGEPFLTHELAP